jgi:hypothetical protein
LRPVCPRCWEFFDKKEQLNDHQRAAASCDIKELSFNLSGEGFDERQERELKRRGKHQGRTEKEKWKEMFHILFPEVDQNAIPDPCEFKTLPNEDV